MKELLPLGSIVLLNNGKKRLMIYGRYQLSKKENKIWDYVGCLYPEGNLGPDYNFLFNHEDINEIFAKGYTDEEDAKFIEVINEKLEKKNN